MSKLLSIGSPSLVADLVGQNEKLSISQASLADGASLSGVDLLYLNGFELSGQELVKAGLIAQAFEKGIPVLYEMSDPDAMAQVSAFTCNARLVLLQPLKSRRASYISILDPHGMQQIGFTQEETRLFMHAKSPEGGAASRKAFTPAYADYESSAPVYRVASNPGALARLVRTHLDKFSEVDQFVGTTSFFASGSNNLPAYAKNEGYVDLGPRSWSPDSKNAPGCQGQINVNFMYGLYSVTSPNYKYLEIQTVGTGCSITGSPPGGDWESGYYQEQIEVSYGPSSSTLPSGSAIDKTAPLNAVNSSSVAATTGFSLGVSLGGDRSGPEASISANYDSSKTTTINLTDWGVINQSPPTQGNWKFNMNTASDGTPYRVGDPVSLVWTGLGCFGVRGIPNLSRNNNMPTNETVWRFPNNCTDTLPFSFNIKQHIARCQITWANFFTYTVYNPTNAFRCDIQASFNLGTVKPTP
ncbi:hypothetical protein JKA73_10175 [Myxococcus xanthus]|uniref:hypothetical protein n=1 Tax=Myxococcus xanthus TaxID=34 RepID=UPI00191793CD|nr:hypothetical protein [Myxococcus xanthus]QQR46412.1 hypothetical protein JKA73_10175 [Myxococcus xanthus]